MSEERSRLVGDLVQYIFPAFKGIAQGKDEAYVDLDVGLSIISTHAKTLGYDGLILFLDELILWLATHSADLGFVQKEGNKLAKLVESRKSERPVPIISFVARQRDLRDLIGDNVTGVEQLNFSDVLSHWEGRFHTITLEDRNLPVIAQKRADRREPRHSRADGWRQNGIGVLPCVIADAERVMDWYLDTLYQPYQGIAQQSTVPIGSIYATNGSTVVALARRHSPVRKTAHHHGTTQLLADNARIHRGRAGFAQDRSLSLLQRCASRGH
jgi:hypothetical protein